MAEPRTYTEFLLLGEVERALEERNSAALAALVRIAAAVDLTLPPRVALRLTIRDLLTEDAA